MTSHQEETREGNDLHPTNSPYKSLFFLRVLRSTRHFFLHRGSHRAPGGSPDLDPDPTDLSVRRWIDRYQEFTGSKDDTRIQSYS